MSESPQHSDTSSRFGFLRNGSRELGRKWDRWKLRRQLQAQGRQRGEALTRLGEHAWQEKTDVSAFPEIRDQLTGLDARAGELDAAARKMDADRTALEERRKAEVSKFDGQRKAIEAEKQPVDKALHAARDDQAQRARSIQKLEQRSAALPAELTTLDARITSLSASTAAHAQAQMAAARARREQLLAEQAQLSADLPRAQAEAPAASAELNRLTVESQRHADALARNDLDRTAALAAIDAPLEQLRAQLRSSQQQTSALQKERGGRFAALGLALYGQNAAAASLTEHVQRIAAVDEARAATESALQASLAETQAMPQRTMAKFLATAVLVPGVALAAAAAGMSPRLNPAATPTQNDRHAGSVRCEPLRQACQRLRSWEDCARNTLSSLPSEIAAGDGLLEGEWAGRSSAVDQAAIWQPQYAMIKLQLTQLMTSMASLNGELAAAEAQAASDCGLLPGPRDASQCRDAAARVEQVLKNAREKLQRDLDAALRSFNAVAQSHGASWSSVAVTQGKLQVQQTMLQQCSP